jgi:hypothetical protein
MELVDGHLKEIDGTGRDPWIRLALLPRGCRMVSRRVWRTEASSAAGR